MPRLRALVDVLIFCAVVTAIYFATESATAKEALDLVPRPLRLPVEAFAMAQVSVVFVLVAVARDGDMARSLGLERRPLGRVLAGAAAAWVAIVALAVAFAAILMVVRSTGSSALLVAGPFGSGADDGRLMRELAQIQPLALLPLAAFVGFYEELLFRGFLLNRLRIVFGSSLWGGVLAISSSSALFALGHTYKSSAGIVATFFIGAILGVVSWRMRSIWSSVIAHATIDAMALVGARLAVNFTTGS